VAAVGAAGVAEVVGHGETGLLVDLDAGALATAIRQLLDDPGLRARLAERGRVAVRAYAIEALTDRLVRLYRHVAASARVVAAPDQTTAAPGGH
jgi:glycosyltransferase involved in cell wall biosynthesis